jgi:predicted ferric reductase
MKKIIGYFLIYLPTLIVFILWLLSASVSSRFGSTSIMLLSLGQLSGLLGLSLFATSLWLNSRIKIFNYFLTIGEVCREHHNLGSIGFILMLVHPAVLAIRYSLTSVVVASEFLLPRHNLINLAGLVALFLLSVMMLATYYLTKYRFIWIWSHRMALVAYILAGLHLIFVTSDTSRYPALKYYLLFLMVFGLLAFTYQRVSLYLNKQNQPEAC